MGALHFARGNRKNYDDWAAQGAKGWSFKDVYPYFLRMENNEERQFLANGKYHIHLQTSLATSCQLTSFISEETYLYNLRNRN